MHASTLIGAVILATLATHASAQSSAEAAPNRVTGVYLTGSGGLAHADFNAEDFTPDYSGSILATEQDTVGWKVGIGYQFIPEVAIEAGYTRLGKFSYKEGPARAYNYGPASGASMSVDNSSDAVTLAGVLSVPMDRNFSLLVKLGIAYVSTRSDWRDNYPAAPAYNDSQSLTHSQVNPLLGVGLRYSINRNLALRIEAENYGEIGTALHFTGNHPSGTGRMDLTLYSAGVDIRF